MRSKFHPGQWLCLKACCCCVTSVVSNSVRTHRRQPTRLPSLGFSRQEHWSGLPFPSPVHESEKWKWRQEVSLFLASSSHTVQRGTRVKGRPRKKAKHRFSCHIIRIDRYQSLKWGFPGSSVVKNQTANADAGSIHRVGKIPWRKRWHPCPVFLPRKSPGQKSLMGYSPWCRKESDTTKPAHECC